MPDASTQTAPQDTVQATLLRASAMQHLFRALIAVESVAPRQTVELPLVRLINDVTGTDGGFILLAPAGELLIELARERDHPHLERAVQRACAEGIVREGEITAGPIYLRGKIDGAICMLGPDCSGVLAAILTLASSALESAHEFEALKIENAQLKSEAAGGSTGILGESPGIRQLRTLIGRVAPQEATVLILGESGTGKELVARAVHAGSSRANRPFVAINCAALSDTLLESELFGHERGAFTGAVTQKKGRLEIAEGGSVFLDEVGELAPGLQAKLLRVLQERNFERVGGTAAIPLDIRLIAATNRDLTAAGFRLDLYHRLNVVSLHTPPLRERTGDIPLLARSFLEVSAARCQRRVAGFAPETSAILLRYSWPGNIRELQNAIEHAVILGTSDWILPEDLPETVVQEIAPADLASAYQSAIGETRRDCIVRAWRDAAGDHAEAARILGIHPNSLRRLIRHLGLRQNLR
jgi:Nif-specific regulatory protein